jgi:hypothetical protein
MLVLIDAHLVSVHCTFKYSPSRQHSLFSDVPYNYWLLEYISRGDRSQVHQGTGGAPFGLRYGCHKNIANT